MRILQIKYCSGTVKEGKLSDDKDVAIETWRKHSDDLMMNYQTEFYGLAPGHVVQLTVIHVSDLDPNDPGELELTIYRTCSDITPACPYSHAKKNEPKLYVTKGAVA